MVFNRTMWRMNQLSQIYTFEELIIQFDSKQLKMEQNKENNLYVEKRFLQLYYIIFRRGV